MARLLRYNLEKEGYQVEVRSDGESGLEALRSGAPALAILDLMLPRIDGLELCRLIRRESGVPILMLTARRQEADKVLGLESGADDYLTKPFGVRELLARVKALLRRASGRAAPSARLRAGGLELDIETREARLGGRRLALRFKEFEFLWRLLEAGGKVLTRDQLLEKVWGYDPSLGVDTRTIDQHIARLRGKLGAEAARVVTVKNVGYRLDLS